MNILSFDNRPFQTIEEHDDEIIKRWNATVEDNDDVWVLGDISWYGAQKTIEIFTQLKGHKHLCAGNHDAKLLKNINVRSLFCEICDYKELIVDGFGVVLCHYPIPCFNRHFYGWYHLYGHVHNSFEWNIMERIKYEMIALYDKQCNMINVGCMLPYMRFTPKTLDEIRDGYEEYKKLT